MWFPASEAVSPRRIIDLLDDSVLYTETREEIPGHEPKNKRISRAAFRKWLRTNQAQLDTEASGDTPVSPSTELAKRISSLRRAMGMTQAQLAQALGISRAAVTFMETGRNSSAHRHIPHLAEIFQVPADVFLTGMIEKEIPATLSPDENDLILLYRNLPPERKLSAQKWMERQSRALRKQ